MMAQSEKVLEEARSVAEKIKQDAYEEGFEAGKKSGYDSGFQEGEMQGLAEYQKKMTELEDMLAASILDVETVKEKTLEKYMDDLKEISLAIGEKIVRTSLRSNVRVIERMILAATEKLKKALGQRYISVLHRRWARISMRIRDSCRSLVTSLIL